MTQQTSPIDSFFFGIMVLKDGTWKPHSKHDGGSFGSALIEAESLDGERSFDAVKVMRIPTPGNGAEQKEMWISPHLKARASAKAAAQINAGAKQSKQQIEAAHAQRKGAAIKN